MNSDTQWRENQGACFCGCQTAAASGHTPMQAPPNVMQKPLVEYACGVTYYASQPVPSGQHFIFLNTQVCQIMIRNVQCTRVNLPCHLQLRSSFMLCLTFWFGFGNHTESQNVRGQVKLWAEPIICPDTSSWDRSTEQASYTHWDTVMKRFLFTSSVTLPISIFTTLCTQRKHFICNKACLVLNLLLGRVGGKLGNWQSDMVTTCFLLKWKPHKGRRT